ncbi:MAG: efflux RND transporter periplasmic adaptor subunit [Verrucomicrobiota bacterium]
MELSPSLDFPAALTLPPTSHAAVSAKFSGKVHDLFVKLGDRVRKGQPLAQLDPITIGNPPVTLRSPLDGVVSLQNVKLGDAFGPTTVLMEIADQSRLQARAVTYESPELAQIKTGQVASVRVSMFPDEVFEGKVVSVSPGLRADERTFEVFVEIENPDGKLLPNSQATVSLPLGEPATVVAVPKRAIVGDGARRTVFVRDGNVFERRDVVLGIKSGDLVEIIEGVFPGDDVVIQGNYQLQFASGEPSASEVGHGHSHGGHSHGDHGAGDEADHEHSSFVFWIVGGMGVAVLILLLQMGNRGARR